MVEEIGGYRLRGELARGARGVVYRAWDPALEREVALKILLDASAADAEDLRRFRLEARLGAGLRHPGIVGTYDFGDWEGRPFLVMELVEGESLAQRLVREGPLSPREALVVTARVAEALHYAHGQGVIHRDVKPANVILEGGRRPVLTDFGFAREVAPTSRYTSSGEAVGTPAYMAPEQATADRARLGPACDVYGLGATLYAMLCGRPPFQGASFDVMQAVVFEEPDPPSAHRRGLEPELDRLVLRCLNKDPERRFPTALALGQAALALLGDGAAGAGPAPAARAGVPRWLWGALAAEALLTLVLGGAVWQAWSARAARADLPPGEAR